MESIIKRFKNKNPHLKDTVDEFVKEEINRLEKRHAKISKWIKKLEHEIFILDYEAKVYEQRTFPTTLRNYIFNRDNFTCKICNTHKDNLPDKINLEVDHITPWADGGETKLSNGQTICSDCNKGKHHSKKYLKLVV